MDEKAAAEMRRIHLMALATNIVLETVIARMCETDPSAKADLKGRLDQRMALFEKDTGTIKEAADEVRRRAELLLRI